MSEIIVQSLVLPIRNNQINLSMKKEGEKLGTGKYNGPGGHVEPGETVEECAVRESFDEITITPTDLRKVAEIHYLRPHSQKIGHIVVHIFICTQWQGEPTETNIMVPEWFDLDKVPYNKMWQSDRYWLPLVLGGEVLRCTFNYDLNDNLIGEPVIEKVDAF